MMPKRYSVEFKQRVVGAVIWDSRPIADVAREYGFVAQTLEGIGSRRVADRTPSQKTSYRCPNKND